MLSFVCFNYIVVHTERPYVVLIRHRFFLAQISQKCGWGCAPDSAWGAYSAPQTSYLDLGLIRGAGGNGVRD